MNKAEHRGIASLSIRRPIGTIAISSVVVVLGFFFLSRLPLDLLPQITYPQIRVIVTYPGVAPEVMEEQVTRILETNLATTENLTRLESETSEGRVDVNLYFSYDADINLALQDASKNLDRARSRLPEDVEPPTIFKFDPSQLPIYEVGIRSANRNQVELRDWAERRLAPQLLTIEGVASVDVSGGLAREVHVTLDQERLRSYGLTVSDVLNTLRRENQDVAAGNLTSSQLDIIGKTSGKFESVGEIRSVLLPTGNGGEIHLSDIATVADTSQDQRLWVRLNGEPAVKISVRKQPDANTVAVTDAVVKKMESLKETSFIPDDISSKVVFDQSFFIRNAVGSVSESALYGGGLAMLVVFLFLGSLRKTFIIGLAIPLAIMATFVMMGMSDLTLNIMSLGGLALGVGMLVDNSIVMLENIFRHRATASDAETAAHEGSAEVTSAVIASTLTNLAAVVPFLLITGLSALIFQELILTISFAILASLAVALTLVPMLAALLAKIGWSSKLEHSWPIRMFDRGVLKMTEGYRRLLRGAVRFRWIVAGSAVGLLVVAMYLTSDLGSEFLPTVDDGSVSVRITLAPGTPPERTNQIALRLEKAIGTMPYVQSTFTTAGGFLFGNSTSLRGGRGGIDIQLIPASQRPDMPAGKWVAALQVKVDALGIPGARISVRPPRIRGLRTSTSDGDVAISVQGDDLMVLNKLGADVIARLHDIKGLEALQPSTEEASPQLTINVDRQRAADLGLNVEEVGQTVRTALDGSVPTRYTAGAIEYDVRVRLPREQFTSAEDIGSIALFPGGSQPIYLRDIADVGMNLGPTTILRENQNRLLRITGDVNDAETNIGEVMAQVRARLAGMDMPEGYGIILGGEEEAIAENQRNLLTVTLLAVFLVFVVMAVQYENITNPLVILVAIPLSLIGVGFMLWATATPLSAPVLLGVILLVGIVVNNAILLVEYAEIGRHEQGLSAVEAVIQAGATRLRPILMTTLTTVLGMIPLSLGLGEGSELMQPLAIAVVGGLSISTLLTLLVVPGIYLIFNDTASRLGALITRRRSSAIGGVATADVLRDPEGD